MWFAYAVASQRELALKETLSELGFGVALPMHTRMKKRANSRRRIAVTEPLIRGYIFVDVPADVGWWPILHVRHIHGIIGIAGHPIEIDKRWLDQVSAKKEKKSSTIKLEPGARVEIVGGPAEGHMAKVIEARGEFARVYFDAGNIPISVRTEFLERIE